jgi:acyl-CoA reductase-like NAD-dependent aldehyde dehydrogenase
MTVRGESDASGAGQRFAPAGMLIGGAVVDGPACFDVTDPASGEVFATAPACATRQLDQAFEAASAALRSWGRDEDSRRQVLADVAALLLAEGTHLARLITAEQGKPLGDASLEIQAAAKWLRYFAELPVPVEVLRSNRAVRVEVSRRPMGVVAAITPANFPILLAAWKLGPDLLAGNTVVLKPSPFCPLTALRAGELLAGVIPPGVVNVVSGGADLGRRMVAHPVPRRVSFTGSLPSGREVAVLAAHGLKRTTLELGGNDAAIVLDDVDVETVADDLFWGAFHNNGQLCAAIKRVYAPRHMVEDLAEALARVARSVRVGPGLAPDTQLGPVGSRPALARIGSLVQDAIRLGGRVRSGGAPLPGPGFFYPPTIITGLPETAALVAEEQFGPALPVLGYLDVAEAVRLANATVYGLSGSVWGADDERAAAVAARLECGTAWVNTHRVILPDQPFGGVKSSGIGVENGRWGLDDCADLQVLHRMRSS